MVKVLHTADWHLGASLCQKKREPEHEKFLDWLYETIKQRNINVLLIVGDIFDSYNPPNSAQKLFFDFIFKVVSTLSCKIVISSGNHDSSFFFEALKKFFSLANVEVVSSLSSDVKNHFVEIDESLCLCVLPYIKDTDFKAVSSGESQQHKLENKKKSIIRILKDLTTRAYELKKPSQRLVLCAHLTVGKQEETGELPLPYADLSLSDLSSFRNKFDYLALGHLHRPHFVGSDSYVRYCGSPLQMNFGESEVEKKIIIINFANSVEIEELEVPVFRSLIKIEGNTEEIKLALSNLQNDGLTPWVQVCSDDEIEPLLQENFEAEILKILKKSTPHQVDYEDFIEEDEELTPKLVFEKFIENIELDKELKEELSSCYMSIVHRLTVSSSED